MAETDYTPAGNTPLLDAIGAAVATLEQAQRNQQPVLVVIQTDGHENSSREWTKARIQALVKEKETTGYWTFVFLGADIDAFAEGASVGVAYTSSASYRKNQTREMYTAIARSIVERYASRVRSGQMNTPNLAEEISKILESDDAVEEIRKAEEKRLQQQGAEAEQARRESIALYNQKCDTLSQTLRRSGLTCPHCGRHSKSPKIRFIDRSPTEKSVFMCDCARSFGPDDLELQVQ